MMVRGFLETPVPNDLAYSPAIIAKSVAEGLQAKGHEVTFYGPEGTHLDVLAVKTLGLRPLAKTQNEFDEYMAQTDLFEGYRTSLYDEYMARSMLQDAKDGAYDCVMFNHFESALPLASLFPEVPIIYILHDFIDGHRREQIEMFASPNQHFISISNSQRRDAPDLNYAATVYNGIDTTLFSPDGEPEDYLMISGRITPAKGVKEAVQIAMQAGQRLLITGSLSKSDSSYFDEYIKPHLNNKILFLGMLERDQLAKYYKKAAGILLPIQWQEPFGLVMAEAGACGTPVIAFNRGSVPEVVVDGKTGFVVNNSAEMILAIEKLHSIKRRDCREHIVKNFSIEHMVDGYDQAITSIVRQDIPNKRQKAPLHEKIRRQAHKISQRLKDY